MTVSFTTPTALTWGAGDAYLEGAADGTGAVSNLVSPSTSCNAVQIQGRITTGTSPTDGSLIQFYLIRSIDSVITASVTTPDDLDATEVGFVERCAQPVHTIRVNDTSDKLYVIDFNILLPGDDFAIAIVNNTGVALGGDGTHEVNYSLITW